MSKNEKLLAKLKSKPKDFTYTELVKLLSGFGFLIDKKGKTSGARVAFYHKENLNIIRLHKPHPNNELKRYQINEIIKALEKFGVI